MLRSANRALLRRPSFGCRRRKSFSRCVVGQEAEREVGGLVLGSSLGQLECRSETVAKLRRKAFLIFCSTPSAGPVAYLTEGQKETVRAMIENKSRQSFTKLNGHAAGCSFSLDGRPGLGSVSVHILNPLVAPEKGERRMGSGHRRARFPQLSRFQPLMPSCRERLRFWPSASGMRSLGFPVDRRDDALGHATDWFGRS